MMRSKLFRSLLLGLFGLTCLTVKASHINETVSLIGNNIVMTPNCAAVSGPGILDYADFGDPFNMSYPGHWDIQGGFNVSLRFNDQLRTDFGFKAIKVIYSLRLRPDINNSNSNLITDTLVIYTSKHTKYVDQAINYHENVDADPTTPSTKDHAFSARLCITAVLASTNYNVDNGSGTWTSVSGTLDADYYLDLNYHVERYFMLNTSTQITLSETNNIATCSTSVAGQWTCNDITVNWNKLDGAEAYELEWLFIDMGNEPFTTDNYEVDWRNATRIRLESTAYTYGSSLPMTYKIPLGYPRGRLVYRIRGTGYLVETVGSNKEIKPIYGKWSGYVPGTLPDYLVPLSSSITVDKINLPGMENTMNWKLSTTYSENGKRKDILEFYDGAFKPRQTTTFVNSDNNVVIGEARYDYMGRNAVNIIPAVKTSQGMKFYGVNVNSSPYWGKDNFDLSAKVYGPDSISNGVAYDYYSVNNTTELYVPNAKGYPYTRTIYSNDGTNRVISESGIGRDHKIGSGHETQYLYGRPTIQKELDRLFGNEVGFLDHYQKNAVKDANGQVTVSYLDATGNVIATALSGSLPGNANVLQVDNEVLTPVTMTGSLLGSNALSLDGEEMISTQTIIVTSPGTYTFNYNLTEKDTCNDCLDAVIPALENGCVDCKYDLTIIVRDVNSGQYLDIEVLSPLATYTTPKTFPNQSSWTNLGFTVNFTSFGSYEITKKLKLNRTDLNATLITLIDELIDQRDAYRDGETETKPQCIPYNNDPEPCDDCESLCEKVYSYKLEDETTGDPIYYNSTTTQVIVYFNESDQLFVISDDFPGYMPGMTESIDSVNAIISRIDICKGKCELDPSVPLIDECSVKWRSIRSDMSPGGQYFDNLPDQFSVGYDPNDWLEAEVSATPTGIIPGFTTWNDVRNNWDTSYATILVNYHPEICTYRYYCLLSFDDKREENVYDYNNEFDQLMNQTNDDASALLLGLFDPIVAVICSSGTNGTIYYNELNTFYPSYLNTSTIPTLIQDPYFTENVVTLDEMAGYLSNYVTFTTETTMVSITLSVYDIMADNLNIHSEPLDGTSDYPDAIIQFMQALHGDGVSDLCGLIENGVPACSTEFQMTKFQFFKSYYMFMKRKIQQKYMADWMNETNCSSSLYPNYPLDACTTSCAGTPPCDDCYLTSQDSNGDGFTDDGFFINYPYIDLFNIDMSPGSIGTITSSVEEDICLGEAAALASQWVSQMEMTMLGCQGVNMPFSMEVRNKLRHYFYEVAKAACSDAGIGNTFTTGHTIPNYSGVGGWGTMSITSSTTFNDAIDDVIALFETNEPGFSCINHIMYPSTYVSGTDTITDKMACACNNFGFYIIGNAVEDDTDAEIESPFETTGSSFDYYTIPGSMTTSLSSEFGFTVTEATLVTWADKCFSNDYVIVSEIPEEFFIKFKCDEEGGTSVPGCSEQNQIIANYTADHQFENNLDALVENLRNSYKTSCMGQLKTREKFDVTYDLAEYHYTLYYYDQAGNLIKTVPPAGVVPITNTSGNNRLDFVNAFRVAHHTNVNYTTMGAGFTPIPPCSSCTTGFIYPAHTKVTNYVYNSLNQPVQQYTPDAGFSKFFYDALGRLVLSQNSDQASASSTHQVYSYTLYDYLGRVEEVGELRIANGSLSSCLPSGYTVIDSKLTETPYQTSLGNTPFMAFMSDNDTKQAKVQITKTFYDEQQIYAKQGNTAGGTPLVEQINLRNRVVTKAYYEKVPLVSSVVDWQYYDNATHYSYDIHGNVKKIAVDIPAMQEFKHRFFTTDYEFDLISGKVNLVAYQKGFTDQFYHKYIYDADNRITEAYTSRDSSIWEKDARYFYYQHGLVKRIELGDKNVQGMDYAYTINGWLKQINASDLNINLDPGKDGRTGTGYTHGSFAIDAFGYTLGYYDGDYKPVGIASSGFYMPVRALKGSGTSNLYNSILPSTGAKGLYNGNITSTQIAMMDTGGVSLDLMGNAYKYDQLNRIKESNSFLTAGVNMTTGTITNYHWDGVTNSTDKYKTSYTYDPDGNLKTLLRNGGGGTVAMDNFTYTYTSDKNWLTSVADPTTAGNYPTDIDGTHTYTYYNNGNLKTDAAENIAGIDWTVYGKVKKIRRVNNTNKDMMNFYDPEGQRLMTLTVDGNSLSSPTYNDETKTKTTLYIRDASGNIMSIYEVKYKGSGGTRYELAQVDIPIYACSRLGVFNKNTVVATKTCSSCNGAYPKWEQSLNPSTGYPNSSYTIATHGQVKNSFTKKRKRTLGIKNYELNNHLGNVQVTISDRKKTKQATGGVVDYYKPDVRTYYDYYPFGMPIPGRSFTAPECNMTTTPVTTEVNMFTQDFESAAITYYGAYAHQRMTYDGWYNTGTGYSNNELRSAGDKWMKVESNDDGDGMRKVSPTLSLNTSYTIQYDLSYGSATSVKIDVYNANASGVPQGSPTTYTASSGNNQTITYTTGGTWNKIVIVFRHNYDGETRNFYVDNIILKLTASPFTQAFNNNFNAPTISATGITMTKYQFDAWTPWSHSELYQEDQSGGNTRVKVVTTVGNHGAQRYFDGFIPAESYTMKLNIDLDASAAQVKVFIWDVDLSGTVSNERAIITANSTGNYTGNFVPLYNRILVQVRRSTGSTPVWFYMDNFSITDTIYQVATVNCASDENYRFGFNSQMKDNEIYGEGNAYNFEYRVHDPRLGRFMSLDPLMHKYPWQSPYSFAGNDVIRAIDLEGLEIFYSQDGKFIGQYGTSTVVFIVTQDKVEVDKALALANSGVISSYQLHTSLLNNSWSTEFDTKAKGNQYTTFRVSNGKIHFTKVKPLNGTSEDGKSKACLLETEAGSTGSYYNVNIKADFVTAEANNYAGDGSYMLAIMADAKVAVIDADGVASIYTPDKNLGAIVTADGQCLTADADATLGILTGENGKKGVYAGAGAGAYVVKGQVTPAIMIGPLRIGWTFGGSAVSAHIGAGGGAYHDNNKGGYVVEAMAHIGLGVGYKWGFSLSWITDGNGGVGKGKKK